MDRLTYNLVISPTLEGGQTHLQSGNIPNSRGWTDSPTIWQYPQLLRVDRLTYNLVISPTLEGGQTHLQSGNIPKSRGWTDSPTIWQYPQLLRVDRLTYNLAISTTLEGGQTHLQSGNIPNSWGWTDSPQPNINQIKANTPTLIGKVHLPFSNHHSHFLPQPAFSCPLQPPFLPLAHNLKI